MAGWKHSDVTGFPDAEPDEYHATAADFAHEGFSPDEALTWHQAGFRPAKARQWHDEGFSVDEAPKWRDSGCQWPSLARQYHTAGVSSERVRHAYDSGIEPDLELLTQCDDRQISEWAAVLTTDRTSPASAGLVKGWISTGANPAEASRWITLARSSGDSSGWKDVGFRQMTFLRSHVDVGEVTGPLPLTLAVSRALGVPPQKVEKALAGKPNQWEAARTMFRRRRQQPPF
jgi:hypothetical protein